MPNRNTHIAAGVLAGVAFALYCARNEAPAHRLVEVFGGAVGGYVGGRLPDILDPPLSPLHRSFAHGGVAVGTVVLTRLEAWRHACRRNAAQCAADGAQGGEILHLLLAGLLTGLQAGYASHLLLDLGTPRGLPLLGR